jgi:hypothetical protein
MVTCPNGHANPEHQQYCGQCGAPLAVPGPPPHVSWPTAVHPPGPSRRRRSRWLLITAVSVAVVAVVAALTVWLTNRRTHSDKTDSDTTDSDRWSAFPHTMGCTVDTSGGPMPPPPGTVAINPPEPTQVQQVILSHPGGQQLAVSIRFAGAPQTSRFISQFRIGQGDGDPIMISSPISPGPQPEWAAVYQRSVSVNNFDPIDLNVESVNVTASTVDLTIDVGAQAALLGDGPFKPDVWVYTTPNTNTPTQLGYYNQFCAWGATTPPIPRQLPNAQPAPTAPTAIPVPPTGQPPRSNAPYAGQYVRTESGRVRCDVGTNDANGGDPVVVCEATSPDANPPADQIGFPQAPTDPPSNCPPPPGTYLRCVGPIHWDLAVIHPAGAFNWAEGNIGASHPQDDLILAYGQTYHISGWTILPSSDGTRFTNDTTGHGMFVSIENVYSF